MVETIVTFVCAGKECEETVSFGSRTREILEDPLTTPLSSLIKQRYNVEEWYEYWYGMAVKFYWEYVFEIGFIPRTIEPRQRILPSDIQHITFPDGWVLYRDAKSDRGHLARGHRIHN